MLFRAKSMKDLDFKKLYQFGGASQRQTYISYNNSVQNLL